jgi:hypothetical protein
MTLSKTRPSTAPPATGNRTNIRLAAYQTNQQLALRNVIRKTISKALKNKSTTAKAKKRQNRQTRRRR